MSINQYTMSNLVSKQHVKRRRASPLSSQFRFSGEFSPAGVSPARSLSLNSPRLIKLKETRSKPAFRPEGILNQVKSNKKLIEGIRQRPCKKGRPPSPGFMRKSSLPGKAAGTLRGEGAARASPPAGASSGTPALRAAGKGPRGLLRITASLLPLLGFTLLLFAAVAALTWEKDALSSWFSRAPRSVAPEAVGGGAYNLALYAGLAPLEAGSPAADEEIPLDLAESLSWKEYTVKKGDSVSGIAAKHGLSMDAVIASNGIGNARRIREGDLLRIPNMDGIPYTVKKGDSFSRISKNLGAPLEAILDANNIQSDIVTPGTVLFIPGARMKKEDLKLALGELFIYPLAHFRLTSPFGWRNDPISGVRRHHAAVDLAAPTGTPVKSAMDGKVSSIGYNSVYGNFIILSHDGGYQTLYAHLSAVMVAKGGRVVQGAKIGEVGSTGYSTGSHLHFGVYKNGRAVNPMELLTP
jgi:murein DD-endopeptidase MepM/ murein hydrolase activator NlpD